MSRVATLQNHRRPNFQEIQPGSHEVLPPQKHHLHISVLVLSKLFPRERSLPGSDSKFECNHSTLPPGAIFEGGEDFQSLFRTLLLQ